MYRYTDQAADPTTPPAARTRSARFVSHDAEYVVETPVSPDQSPDAAARTAVTERYDTLCGTWTDSIDQLRARPSITAAAAEQEAYEQLVDHVEDHGWAGTPLDPRDGRWPSAGPASRAA